MKISLIHIYCDENRNNLSSEVNIPMDNLPYCIEIIQSIEKIKYTLINQVSVQNHENLTRKKGFVQQVLSHFKGRAPKQLEEKMKEDIAGMVEAEKMGKGIRQTLMHLQNALKTATVEDRNRIIKDINGAIKRITGGA